VTTTPLPQDKILNFLNELTYQIIKVGTDMAIAWAKTQQPWLAWPIISTIFGTLVDYISGIVSKSTQLAIDDAVLDIQKNFYNAAVIKAAGVLKADGGNNDTDVQNLANAEAGAISFPGIGTVSTN
jgi:hypothetical protein